MEMIMWADGLEKRALKIDSKTITANERILSPAIHDGTRNFFADVNNFC